MAKDVRIYKHKIDTYINMGNGSQFLSVGLQDDAPVIWTLEITSNPIETRKVGILPTGAKVPDDVGTYLGTYQTSYGFVGHVFFQ